MFVVVPMLGSLQLMRFFSAHSCPTSRILNCTCSLACPSLEHLKIITLCSGAQKPYSLATLSTRLTNLSPCCIKWEGTLYPMTPLQQLDCLTTLELTEQARIIAYGLCLAMALAIAPFSVITTIKATLFSRANSVAYEQRISVTVAFFPNS